jgi:hypothetical protein
MLIQWLTIRYWVSQEYLHLVLDHVNQTLLIFYTKIAFVMLVYQRQRLGCERCLIVFKLTAIIYILLSVFAIEKISWSFFTLFFLFPHFTKWSGKCDWHQRTVSIGWKFIDEKSCKTLYLKMKKYWKLIFHTPFTNGNTVTIYIKLDPTVQVKSTRAILINFLTTFLSLLVS